MSKTKTTPSAETSDRALLEHLRSTIELLERVAADRAVLDSLSAADRERLQKAVAGLYHPDPLVRRQKLKAAERERRRADNRREDAVLNETGIRALRRRPVFTTPNVLVCANATAPPLTLIPTAAIPCPELSLTDIWKLTKNSTTRLTVRSLLRLLTSFLKIRVFGPPLSGPTE